jgi:hypothetical protein
MGPKIEAALRFLDEGGEFAVVTTPALLAATLGGRGQPAGTRIKRAVTAAVPQPATAVVTRPATQASTQAGPVR